MLSIGRALMTNPTLLILDEATEGLAPLIVAEIWRVIGRDPRHRHRTLIVDRNVRQVLAHTDRAVVLEKGLVVLSPTAIASLGQTGLQASQAVQLSLISRAMVGSPKGAVERQGRRGSVLRRRRPRARPGGDAGRRPRGRHRWRRRRSSRRG
jgi:ABC-type branched-subunit amino acid transport system ATPase component